MDEVDVLVASPGHAMNGSKNDHPFNVSLYRTIRFKSVIPDLACLLSVIIKLVKSRTASNGGVALKTSSRNMPILT